MPDRLRPALVQLGLAVLVLAGVGALAGVVWEWVWTAPVGVVADHKWVAQDESNLRGQFSGTGWYVVVASVAGLVGGSVVALFVDRLPLVTLLGVVVGSVLGAWLMFRVGVALGPPDPAPLALTAREGSQLPARLDVSRVSPLTAMPTGALVAVALVFIGLSAAHRHTRDDAP